MRFGEVLREVREARGWSQYRLVDHFADEMANHSHISRLESGTRRPSVDFVARLCAALGATAQERTRLYVSAGFLPPLSASDVALVTDVLWRLAERGEAA